MKPKCQVKNCENDALVAYGGKWICGEHMNKVIEKQKEMQMKQLEELE